MARFENDTSTTHPMDELPEPGSYSWCQCGRTKTVPWCDGSHEGTGITPLDFEVRGGDSDSICNCGLTMSPPYCDGSHTAIS